MTRPTPRTTNPRGFSLVETAIATVLVGGLFVVAMNMVGASRMTQARYADREHAMILAEDLLNEILAQPYEAPDGGGITFGIESGELLSLRVGLDEGDDYHGYTESPPEDRNGNPIPGAERFTRGVSVQRVKLNDARTASTTETGVKKITVTVTLAGRKMAELSGLRTADWPDADAMSEATP